MRIASLILLFCWAGLSPAQSSAAFDKIVPAVEAAIKKAEVPGAVVLVSHKGETVYLKAVGNRAVEPNVEAMTTDTIFDMASVTKSMATAGSVWKLVEMGKLKMTDKVVDHWPEFTGHKKETITIEQLLLHTSGLIADNPEADYLKGKAEAFKRIAELKLEADPGTRFKYSDVGYIVLGHLVERLSGQTLDQFAIKNLFEPLGLKDTGYLPAKEKLARIAPTGKRKGAIIRGAVHDPRAFALDNVAGDAGLFSTAEEVAMYGNMLLQGGTLNGKQIFKPETVKAMTEPVAIPGGFRSRGWDVDTAYTGQAGNVFNRRKGFGHTGYTGTSIWVDTETQSVTVVLSNRVHPNDKGNSTPLRRAIATIVGKALTGRDSETIPELNVSTGIDVLKASDFAILHGKRVGLVTNHTGRDREGNATIDVLHKAKGVQLVALFSPEHGIRGQMDQENIGDTKDEKTGLPVFSLYAGKRRKPTPEMLKEIDVLVYDIQDIGCRFYTYISTLGNAMESAHENGKAFIVLDRPNPIGGLAVQGPLLDPGKESFVAYHSLPVRHGMTVGEIAKMLNEEKGWKVPLQIVKVENWKRTDTYDKTGLAWVNPSPNMRNLTEALLYPGIGLLETTNISVGRGTERPFEWIGAPYIDGVKLAQELAKSKLPGITFVPTNLTPTTSKFAKEPCGGVAIIVTNWATVDPVKTGLAITLALRKLHPEAWSIKSLDTLLRHTATLEKIRDQKTVEDVMQGWEAGLKEFEVRRAKYLIYRAE